MLVHLTLEQTAITLHPKPLRHLEVTITHLHSSSPRNEDFHGFLFGVGDIAKASLWGIVKTAFHLAPKKLMPLGEINGILPNLPVNRGGTSWNQACLGLTGRVRDDRIRDHNSLGVFSVLWTRKSIKIESNRSLPKKIKTKHLTGWHVIYTRISIFSLEISVHEPCFGLSCENSNGQFGAGKTGGCLKASLQIIKCFKGFDILRSWSIRSIRTSLGKLQQNQLEIPGTPKIHSLPTAESHVSLLLPTEILKNGSRFPSLILVFLCSQHHSPSSSCVGF